MQDPIHIILTGGTLDSYWDSTKDTAVPLEHSALPKFIESLRLSMPVRFTEVCMKDSRSLDQDDRLRVLETINASEERKIIVTHGTYTMPDTAKYLKANLAERDDRIVILTGAMVPLTGFAPSDAPFNIGYALAKTEDAAPGIYVAMNGRLFDPDEVVKLLAEGRFSSVFSS